MFEGRPNMKLTPLEFRMLNALLSVQQYLTARKVERRAYMELMAEIRGAIVLAEEKELGPGNRGRDRTEVQR